MGDFQIPQPDMSGGGSSPSFMYSYIIFREWCAWSDRVSMAQDDLAIDKATAVLLAICPDMKKREQLWELYTTKRTDDGKDSLSAASMVAGGLMTYLANILEFTSTDYGAF
jgi:hypothetical protein